MSKYLKKFETLLDYEAAESGLILPNVSLITENNTVHYNPSAPTPIETKVETKFNVTDTSSPTQIIGQHAGSPFSEIEIDGVVQTSVISTHTFATTGEHTVKYTLAYPTSIGDYAFDGCTSLTTIDMPNSVTSIGNYAFSGCSSLISIDIPDGVTSIGSYAFRNCGSLTSIVSNATTAPTIQSNTFRNVKTSGTLIVPSGSSGYDVWMGTGNYYLGLYNWTKVEQ